MSDIIYDPDLVGTDFVSKKGKKSRHRKYHLTKVELLRHKAEWDEEVKHFDPLLLKKAGPLFFNPYRKGIYYYQVQTLFLLGANEWHSLVDIVSKLEDYTSSISLSNSIIKSKGFYTAWDKFRGKSSRPFSVSSKDYIGRIQENYTLLQRLSQKHPSGYKLRQVCSALDIRRESYEGFGQGVYYYRLSTYDSMLEALPIKDFNDFSFPSHESKYVSKKFVGTIITKDKTIVNGVVKDG